MDEGRDTQLAFIASVLLVIIIAGQVVLLAAHLWVPMAGAAEWLLEDEPPLDESAGGAGTAAEPAPAARSARWLSVAIASAVVAAGLAGLAAFMLRGYTVEVRRWRWVLALGGLATVWGLLVAWMIWRSSEMFGRAFWGGG